MSEQRRERVSDLLFRIADLVQEADGYLAESSMFPSSLPRPRKKSAKDTGPGERKKQGIEPNKRDMFSRLERRVREKGSPMGRDVLRSRRERKARARYQALKNVAAPPRKTLGTTLRQR